MYYEKTLINYETLFFQIFVQPYTQAYTPVNTTVTAEIPDIPLW